MKYCEDKFENDFKENDNKIADFKNGRSHRAVRLEKSWRDYEKKSKYEKKAGKMPDPTPSKFRPDSNFGSVTDTIDKMIEGTVWTQIQISRQIYLALSQRLAIG